MPYPDDPHGPRSYGQMFLILGHIAAACFVLLVLRACGLIANEFGLIGTTIGMLSVIVMFSVRNSDEWIAALWSAGANAGFVAAMGWLLVLPFAEGFFDGLTGNESGQDLPAGLASVVALGAFLLALYSKRIRGL